jgi:NadR type nicotinamide-nucleotide adenylyltransferase
MIPSVVLHGPESTGKSTLAAQLAAHYRTVWVHEYGRTYCEVNGTDLETAELVTIMEAHVAERRALEPVANGFIIQDTDPVMTAAWSMMLFGKRNPVLDAFTDVGQLYLLTDIDLPWVGDAVRMFPDRADQQRFFSLCEAELVRRNLPYQIISGTAERRFETARSAIDEMLGRSTSGRREAGEVA